MTDLESAARQARDISFGGIPGIRGSQGIPGISGPERASQGSENIGMGGFSDLGRLQKMARAGEAGLGGIENTPDVTGWRQTADREAGEGFAGPRPRFDPWSPPQAEIEGHRVEWVPLAVGGDYDRFPQGDPRRPREVSDVLANLLLGHCS
jgi:hypothetical protein